MPNQRIAYISAPFGVDYNLKVWECLAFTLGTVVLMQADEAIPDDQAHDQQGIPAPDRLPLPGYERHHLQVRPRTPPTTQDDSIIFKAQLMPKELEEIWIEVFNYINAIVDLLKPTKTIVLALDGVAPRCKMNNQRSRRFRSAQDYK